MFADDEQESNPTSFKFLQMAHAWKSAQAKTSGGAPTLLSGFTASSAASAASGGSMVIEEKNDGTSDVANLHGSESE
jgi:crooked neck